MKAIIDYPGHVLHRKAVETGELKAISHNGHDIGLHYTVTANSGRYKGSWWMPFKSVRMMDGISGKLGNLI